MGEDKTVDEGFRGKTMTMNGDGAREYVYAYKGAEACYSVFYGKVGEWYQTGKINARTERRNEE